PELCDRQRDLRLVLSRERDARDRLSRRDERPIAARIDVIAPVATHWHHGPLDLSVSSGSNRRAGCRISRFVGALVCRSVGPSAAVPCVALPAAPPPPSPGRVPPAMAARAGGGWVGR